MKLIYNWLKKILQSLKLTPRKSVKGLEKVIAVKIIDIKPHPNADRLRIVTVDTGEQKMEIVCGAPNVEIGQMVPLALKGAKLPCGIEIKESVIRGVKSEAMLCAKDELGLGQDHTGIYILPQKAKIGERVDKFLR
ncbi:MAG: hypothetical protein PHE59_02690 [Patescibacteria group bacterium]|nr:hypothetical protein [Patescibacteria group bacterium]MDD5164387.1 hypothetical protein [Patescibacteria group bacterium]MDD5534961.1 hypothetical protein [Patescibacteria group bacterium]